MVHAGAELGYVGEADAEREQIAKLAWLVEPRRQPDLVQREPEAIAATGVVVAKLSRALARLSHRCHVGAAHPIPSRH